MMPENANEPPKLLLLGSSHRTAPLEVRERFALSPERLGELYQSLREHAALRECLVLNTCNRVEIYAVAEQDDPARIYEVLEAEHGIPGEELTRYGFVESGEAVVRHAFAVAAGLDSQMVGETEILGQVKASYLAATQQSAAGPVLHRVFQKSFQAAKWARTHTQLGAGQVSLGNVAVDLAARVCGDLREAVVLLAGTGEAGQKTAQALVSRGASQITVLSREASRAQTVAGTFQAASGALADLPHFLPHADIVIGATHASTPLLAVEPLKAVLRTRAARPFFLIDLGLPRNFEATVAKLRNVYLYNLDDLAEIANENLRTRLAEVDKTRAALDERAAELWQRLRG